MAMSDEELTKKYKATINVLTCPYIDVSSTEIRARIKEGKTIRYMVTDDTLNYINKFNLYRD